MPKRNFISIKLPAEQPARCADCPLCGLIPAGQNEGKWTHVCCATQDALTRRGIQVNAREKDSKHPWHRPCDKWWDAFIARNPLHEYGIPVERYFLWRKPYEDTLQLTIRFPKR